MRLRGHVSSASVTQAIRDERPILMMMTLAAGFPSRRPSKLLGLSSRRSADDDAFSRAGFLQTAASPTPGQARGKSKSAIPTQGNYGLLDISKSGRVCPNYLFRAS